MEWLVKTISEKKWSTMPMNEKDIPYVLRDRKSDIRGV
jgi:hypothetical protein